MDFSWIPTGNFSTLEYIFMADSWLNYDSTYLFLEDTKSINLLLTELAPESQSKLWDPTCQTVNMPY